MEERVELHIMFLGDPVVGTENRMFTIYLGGTRIFGVDPIGFKVVKEFRVTVSRKELLDILDAGELHPPPETQYTYINLLESEELKSLKTDGNAREIDGVIAQRKQTRRIKKMNRAINNINSLFGIGFFQQDNMKDFFANVIESWKKTLGVNKEIKIINTIDTEQFDRFLVKGNVTAHFEDERLFGEWREGKRYINAPKRFALGHLQAMYEHFFFNAPLLPEDIKEEDAGDMGYLMLSKAYWHGRRGGRFVDCIAHPETCAHAAYQAGYDTGINGQYPAPFSTWE